MIKYLPLLPILFLTACSAPVSTTKTLNSPQPPTPVASPTGQTKNITHIDLPVTRTVIIYGEIGDMGDKIQQIVSMGRSKEPIYLVLKSPGGSVVDGAGVLSAIEAAQGPVYTICDTLCASMAAIIFEHGTKRYMVDRSLVMFHPASGGMQGEMDKMKSRLDTFVRFIGKMEAYIANRVGISFDEYKKLASVELWIDSEDAVNRNYADGLVSVSYPESITVVARPSEENRDLLNHMFLTPTPTSVNINWGIK